MLGRHLFAVTFEATSDYPAVGKRRELGRVLVASPVEGGRWRARPGTGFAVGGSPRSEPPSVAFGSHWTAREGFDGAAAVPPAALA